MYRFRVLSIPKKIGCFVMQSFWFYLKTTKLIVEWGSYLASQWLLSDQTVKSCTLLHCKSHSLASTALKRDSSKGGREGRTVWGGGALGTGSSWLWVSFEHLFDRRFVVAVKLKVEKQMKVLTFNERSNFDFSTCYDY